MLSCLRAFAFVNFSEIDTVELVSLHAAPSWTRESERCGALTVTFTIFWLSKEVSDNDGDKIRGDDKQKEADDDANVNLVETASGGNLSRGRAAVASERASGGRR